MVQLCPKSFGHQYAAWMLQNEFDSNDRPLCQVVQDIELAYVMQRYREIHDAIHVLLGFGVTVPEELAVKWYEMSVLGLPLGALSSISGPLILLNESIKNRSSDTLSAYYGIYLPHVNRCISNKRVEDSEFIMNIYFETFC